MSIETILGGAVVVTVASGGAVGAALLVQRFVPVAQRQANNEVAGLAFAIIGVLYGILLTFVTISVWENNDAAADSSRREGRAVVDLNRYADSLPAPDATRLHGLAGRYTTIVAKDEWPRMAAGRAVGHEGGATLDEIWRAVDGPQYGDGAQAARQAEARATLRELSNARDARLAAIDAGLPGVMWLALIVGSAIALANMLMFGVQGHGEYLTLVAMLAAMSALLLFAVYEMEYPYQRGERVSATTFTDAVGGLTNS